MKTILLSPQAMVSKKSQRMKIILELEEHDLHPFYRFLVFPSMNKLNLHRVCELSSVYLLYERSLVTAEPTSPRPTGAGATEINMMFPTPPKTPKKSFKSIFRRNQQIHIGLHPLSSSVLTALFASNPQGDDDDDDMASLTPKYIENLMTKWLKRFEEKQKTKSNLNLMKFHFHEIEWMSRSIATIQQMCDDSAPAATAADSRKLPGEVKLKRNQRETPYMLTSIQRMRKRLLQATSPPLSSPYQPDPAVLQVIQLIVDPHYLVYTTLPQSVSPPTHPTTSLLDDIPSPLFSQWIQTEMSVQDILHEYFLPAYPLLKHIHCATPSTLLNISPPPPHALQHTSTSQQLSPQSRNHQLVNYSLVQHLFIQLWIETCAAHSVHVTDTEHEQEFLIFHFHSHTIRAMTEETVRDELLVMKEMEKSAHKSGLPSLSHFLHCISLKFHSQSRSSSSCTNTTSTLRFKT
jgi:hypothetical protein